MGHALRKAVGVIARQQGRERPEVAAAAGAPLVAGSSLKAALDMNWDAPRAQQPALPLGLDALTAVAHWLTTPGAHVEETSKVAVSMAVAQQGREQDVITTPAGGPTLRHGVAEDRRMSVEDSERRHGRKSRSRLVDGDKRHGLRALDSGLLVAVGVTPAKAPEANVTEAIATDRAAPQSTLKALHVDRAYLASKRVQQRGAALAIFCKAWPGRPGPHFPTSALHRDWERPILRCPGGEGMPLEPGGVVQFPAAICAGCALRERCTTSPSGRRVRIHPEEALLQELRERQQTAQGRVKLRERVAVEHALAHIGHWQGRRARDCGVRKNVFDLRRCAVVHNLHVLARLPETAQQAA